MNKKGERFTDETCGLRHFKKPERADTAAAKQLKTTVAEYNEACERNYDPIFGKDRVFLKPLKYPPYYALRCYHGRLTTIGGIKINEGMQIIGRDDKPIPGIFACGNNTGGWVADTYDINLAGVTFGYAINSGRMAGEGAASFILGEKKSSRYRRIWQEYYLKLTTTSLSPTVYSVRIPWSIVISFI